jgi:hypothetical protein
MFSSNMRRRIVFSLSAFLILVIATSIPNALSHEYNAHICVIQAEKLHLTNKDVATQYRQITNPRTEINACIQHDSIFDQYIDEICDNTVGHIMMKLLIANMKARHIHDMRIVVGKKDEFIPGPDSDIISIKLSDYDPVTGRAKDALCSIDGSGALAEKHDTLGEALFHELCHAFHSYSGMEKMTSVFLDAVYNGRQEKYLWTDDISKNPKGCEDDEEAYNITGYYIGGFDPISCNMYDICKYASAPESIKQRVLHYGWEDFVQDRAQFPDPLHNIDRFLIDLSTYILDKS